MTSRVTHARSNRVNSWPAPRHGSRRVWSERIWPVLAGALTGFAAIGIWSTYGAVGLLVGTLGTYVFLSMLLYGTVSQAGFTFSWALRTGVVTTLVAVDVTGALVLWPLAGGVALAVVALSSPLLTGVLARAVRRPRSPANRPPATELDQAEVDRIFAELVGGF